MAALASLTENYTDSDEEEHKAPESKTDSNAPPSLPILASLKELKPTPSPAVSLSESTSNRSTPRAPRSTAKRLVSYIDEDDPELRADNLYDTDDEEVEKNEPDASEKPVGGAAKASQDDKNADPVPMDLDSEVESVKEESHEEEEENSAAANTSLVERGIEVEAWTEGVKLPPEPLGQCSPRLQDNINRLYKKKMAHNFDMNALIQNKAFRNPSIYEKLIQFCDIDEHGTNFPKDLYDGHLFGAESYYDELSKVQKADMEKREKAAKERSSGSVKAAEVAAAAAAALTAKKLDDSNATRRKSKWDQGPAVAAAQPATRSIPAFGNLKKH